MHDETNKALFAFGCIISLFSSAYVIITFALKKQRRRHPAALMASRSVCDLCLAMLWLGMTFSSKLDCSSVAGQSAAFLTEFFVIASELLLACLSYDVLVHADDPFVDYKRNLIKYFAFSSMIALCFAIGLLVDVDGVGESFLPICWTCYRGGRVISYSNVSMALFFYIPWSLCFLLSCAAMGRASIVLELASAREDDARTSVLRDSRRVILFHATYWGLLLAVFGPLTNHENNNEEEDVLEHTLRGIVWFLTGARAVENAAVWIRSSSSTNSAAPKRGQAELSPILNIEMQREILNAAVRGMSELLLGSGAQRAATHEYIVAPQQVTVQNGKNKTLEKWYVLYSVLPILLACAICGLVAIVDDNEPSYVSVVFLALFCSIASVLLVSSQWSSTTDRGKVVFASLGEEEGLQELREIWSTPAEVIATALQQCQVGHTRFSISAGKSGAFMFFTPNNRFVVKTVSASEMHTLCTKILPRIPAHAIQGPSSLAKVFACFEMTFCYVNQRTVYLIVMENVLVAQQQLGVVSGTRYDLKGSWLQRTQAVPKAHTMCICQLCHRAYEYNSTRDGDRVCLLAANQGPHRPRMLFKDNDFRERIMGNSNATKLIRSQLSRDVLFLSSLGLMDYSLLISIHRKLTMLLDATEDNEQQQVLTRRTLVASLIESPNALQYGIVDWFTEYSLGKQLEFAAKYYLRFMRERDSHGFLGFSSVDPVQYRDRFMLRVVDVVFPLLNHIVQVVYSNDTTCIALDVTGVTSLEELQRLVASVTTSDVQGALVCLHADIADEPFVITENNFTTFLHHVQARELCTLLIVRREDAAVLMNLY